MGQTKLVPLGDFGRRIRRDAHCPIPGCGQANQIKGSLVPKCPIHDIAMRADTR